MSILLNFSHDYVCCDVSYVVYWIPWPHKHRIIHQDLFNRSTLSWFIGGNVFWWRPSLISNFWREPLECRRVSRDFWNLHTQNHLCANFHASFRKCTPRSKYVTYPPHYTPSNHCLAGLPPDLFQSNLSCKMVFARVPFALSTCPHV